MTNRLAATALLISLVPATSYSQVSGYDVCAQFIREALSDTFIDRTNQGYLDIIHDNYCESGTSKSSYASNIGISTIVDSIPIEFKAGSTEGRQILNRFCANYQATRAGYQNKDVKVTRATKEALSSLNACVAMATSGIYVSHKVLPDSRVNVSVRPGANTPVRIQGVDLSENMTCTGQDPGLDYANVTIDKYSKIVVNLGQVLNMQCVRSAHKSDAAEISYNDGTVVVNTNNHASPQYPIYMPGETRIRGEAYESIVTQIADLKSFSDGQFHVEIGVAKPKGSNSQGSDLIFKKDMKDYCILAVVPYWKRWVQHQQIDLNIQPKAGNPSAYSWGFDDNMYAAGWDTSQLNFVMFAVKKQPRAVGDARPACASQ